MKYRYFIYLAFAPTISLGAKAPTTNLGAFAPTTNLGAKAPTTNLGAKAPTTNFKSLLLLREKHENNIPIDYRRFFKKLGMCGYFI
jgi:hypothetical protein